MPVSCPDVLVIGGGVIGLSTALRLADEGVSVTVVDRQQVGREASWAGAGILPPGRNQIPTLGDTAESRERFLRCLSNSIWPELSTQLFEQTGIDNGYHQCGAIEVADSANAWVDQLPGWESEGITFELLTKRPEIRRHVPGLDGTFANAVWLPEFCQVRNPRHLKALRMACQLSGVEILEYIPDLLLRASGSIVTASTGSRTFSSDRLCISAGAWTGPLLRQLNIDLPIRPVRGQMIQLKPAKLSFRCVIQQGRRYLVPRPDGLILIGSTEEQAGFEKQTTNGGVRGLLDFAASLVPELTTAALVRQWAGLRPGSPEGLPFLGRIDCFDNLFVGAGHFRSGLQMSPGTAQLLAEALTAPGNNTAPIIQPSQQLNPPSPL